MKEPLRIPPDRFGAAKSISLSETERAKATLTATALFPVKFAERIAKESDIPIRHYIDRGGLKATAIGPFSLPEDTSPRVSSIYFYIFRYPSSNQITQISVVTYTRPAERNLLFFNDQAGETHCTPSIRQEVGFMAMYDNQAFGRVLAEDVTEPNPTASNPYPQEEPEDIPGLLQAFHRIYADLVDPTITEGSSENLERFRDQGTLATENFRAVETDVWMDEYYSHGGTAYVAGLSKFNANTASIVVAVRQIYNIWANVYGLPSFDLFLEQRLQSTRRAVARAEERNSELEE